jgi:isopentenyldiphosphate isomerase
MVTPEILQIFDTDGQAIGTMTRAEAEAGNHIIEIALVFIFTGDGRVWIQQRHHTKKHFPGLWDISVCGAARHDETPLQAARREQSEELGFACQLEHVTTFVNEFPQAHGSIATHHRLTNLFIGVSDLQPQLNDEVEAFRAVPPDELRAEVTAHPEKFVPPFLTELNLALKAYQDSPLSRRQD